MNEYDAIIIGAGLAGLSCAVQLSKAGKSILVLEAGDGVGGRARTDRVDGYMLDRGFQVFLSAYPVARDVFDIESLKLRSFEPGAMIRYQGKFHRFSDPIRAPQHALASFLSPVATLGDKLNLLVLKTRVSRRELADIYNRPEKSTVDYLYDFGFSTKAIDTFFRPFLGGVFLDPELETSSRMFEFVFKMFSTGNATLPKDGMGALAQQLASRLPGEAIRLHTTVEQVDRNRVILKNGAELSADAIVIATDGATFKLLVDGDAGKAPQHLSAAIAKGVPESVTCLYFACDRPPIKDPILVLNGEGEGPINNLCFPSQVCPSYAPEGKALVSVTVLGLPKANDEALEVQVRDQLTDWFGSQVADWRCLKSYRIPYALPNQAPPALRVVEKPSEVRDSIYACGDHLDTASIQGAVMSGMRAAQAILKPKQPPQDLIP